jgi:hypothetical protein
VKYLFSSLLFFALSASAQVPAISPVPGVDPGTTINAALASVKGYGIVYLNATATWHVVEPIIIPGNAILDCQGASLGDYGNSPAFIIFENPTLSSAVNYGSTGIRNCHVMGPAPATSSPIGLYLGGDPKGVISPSGSYAVNVEISGTTVNGFSCGLSNGNNAWAVKIFNSAFMVNYDHICSPVATNAGEKMTMVQTQVSDAAHLAFNLNTPYTEWTVTNSWCDYNVVGCIGGNGINMQFTGGHIEQPNGPVISVQAGSWTNYLSLSNMEIILASSTGAERGYMEVQGGSNYADAPYINAINIRLYESHHVPHFLSANGGHVNFCRLGLMQQAVVGAFPTATSGNASIGCDETIK